MLHVIHEKISHNLDDYGLTPQSIKSMETKMVNGARKKLQKQIDKFPQSKEVEVFSEVVRGIPSEEILKMQTEKGIDLIIIFVPWEHWSWKVFYRQRGKECSQGFILPCAAYEVTTDQHG